MEDKKKELLKELLVNEKDILADLSGLVEKSKSFFKIEGNSGKILFNDNSSLTNNNKIGLILIGKYFAYELDVIKKKGLTLSELSEELNIPQTTLSSPLGNLIDKGFVEKNNGEYNICYHKILEFLNNIKAGKQKVYQAPTHRKTRVKKTEKTKVDITPVGIEKHIKEQSGLSTFIKLTEVTQDELLKIFDFEENVINILVHPQGDNEGEKQITATILLLTAYYYYFNEQEISSSELRQKLQDVGITSLVNLSTNLRLYPNLLVHKKSKKGSTNTYYRITIPGLELGRSLIRKNAGKSKQGDSQLAIVGKTNKRSSGLGNEIKKLLEDGFFNIPLDVNSVKKELEKRGIHNPRQEVDSYLRKVLLGKKLIRDKEDGIWKYAVKK